MINYIIRFFRQTNQGFDEVAEQKKMDKEGNHYSNLGGELSQKYGADKVVRADRNWKPEAEKVNFEPQKRNIETMFCTVFNTFKAIAMLQLAKYGFFEDYDEIPTANDAGISPHTGGSPHAVGESVRNTGMFPAGTYPFDDSITSKSQLTITITRAMYASAALWKKAWDFGHEWIWPGITGSMQDSMWHNLQFSPLGVGIYAWYYDKNKKMYVKPSWGKDNHWTVLVVAGEYGKFWWIYDSYKDFSGTPFKKVEWNYPFAFAKKYRLHKKDIPAVERGNLLYSRIQHAEAVQVFPGGAVYEMTGGLIHAPWWTNSKYMQEKADRSLRADYKLGKIIALSKADFEDLISYIKLKGLALVEDKNLQAKLDKIK